MKDAAVMARFSAKNLLGGTHSAKVDAGFA
jgi:hypothetical protein